ncbi:MAG TPA: family 20 glycosylhydrolase [Candidatus Aminicenantes bacterium]|nr:family 20 glycosylhydrolase [Candidatus Aminicenantes bacterium]
MKRMPLLLLVIAGLAGCRARLEPPWPSRAKHEAAIIPQALQVASHGGRFVIDPDAPLLTDAATAGEADQRETARLLRDFGEQLRSQGWSGSPSPRPLYGEPVFARPAVLFAIEPAAQEKVGDEGYFLRITPLDIVLKAARPGGLFYGVQTLRQLLMASPPGMPPSLPCLEIVDRPRYAWRGFMLDCCRHFFPKEFIKKCLDEMALFKLNRFHWHLTDDQAWRIEIRKYPELAERAGKPTGGYYTQEEVREIVAYAAERFITVVPEVEMPGHATAALTVHPVLSCTGGPFARMAQWGVLEDVYCAGNEETFAFLESVLDEVAELFPGPWVHVGGDECPKSRWQACPKCQSRMKAEGLRDEMELQSWFVRRIEARLKSLSKRLIGWDEILEGGLAPEATVMSWRGMDGGIEAARQGHDVVMAPTSSNYIDYYQGDPSFEPPAIGGYVPLESVYAFEPAPPRLKPEEAIHILGGQANLWTEYVATAGHASYMMWPRLAALAEAVWSPAVARDYGSFLRRLGALRPGLKAQGLTLADTAWRSVIRARPLPEETGWKIEMASGSAAASGAKIRYSLDGADPGPGSRAFRRPFTLRKGCVVRAALFAGRQPLAPPVELRLRKHLAAFAPVRVSASGRLRPENGGEALLTDGLDGSLAHKDGAWLGVEGGDLEAVIDLGRALPVRRVATRFLEHPAAWIFPPAGVEAAVSLDDKEWAPAAALDWPAADDFTVLRGRGAVLEFPPRPARYVRLTARGTGLCPVGHVGAGGKAWLFIDEIVVE